MTETGKAIVLGAGPAGMAAAMALRGFGLDVTLVDEQPAPGGQIWRGIETNRGTRLGEALGADYASGSSTVAALRESGCELAFGTQVWQIEDGWQVFLRSAKGLRVAPASAVLLAAGAQERPSPFPGWTLPGVMTVGGAQILLKTSGQIPAEPVWIAGSGPLPLLYMTQLLAMGGRIAGWLDTTPRRNRTAALPLLARALPGWRDLKKGLGWLLQLRRKGVPVIKDVARIEASGSSRLETLTWRLRGGREESAPASLLLVHEGLVPSIHLTMALGCRHDWNDDQLCFVPQLDSWGETSRNGLYVAGDGAGIGGANAARLQGEIAAIGIARQLERLSADDAVRLGRPLRKALERALCIRPFLDRLYRPRPEIFAPSKETLVCRCEEVTAGDILAAAAGGGPNQVKAFTRAGMGLCQGRQCGYAVAHLLANQQGKDVAKVGFFRIRPPLKPVSLGELAGLHVDEPAP